LESAGGWGAEELADAAFTLQTGRKGMRHRRALVCRARGDAVAALRGADPRRLAAGACPGEGTPVAFLLPGQGAQHPGMGAELYAAEPVFRAALDRCCELLRPELGLDLRALLHPPAAADREAAARRLEQTAIAQPALFAVEVALAELWSSWGVRPQAMLGHSLGEYVAAYLAGVFSLEDGLRLMAARGRIMQALPAGAMLGVPLDEEEVQEFLGGQDELSLAAVNAPSACVVSGPAERVAALEAALARRGVEARRLRTSHAFHSRMMEPAVAAFRAVVETVPLSPPILPYLSNVTGAWITALEAVDPGYWARHLRETVRFADGLATLLARGPALVLEVGPGQVLSGFARRQPDAAPRVVASLPRPTEGRSELDALLGALGRLWIGGAEIDWGGFWAGERRRRVPLPTYPFERRRYWVDGARAAAPPEEIVAEPAIAAGGNGRGLLPPRTPLEEGIAAVWRDLLGVPGFGVHDDFFDLGGSSLLGLQLASRLRGALGVEVSSDLLLEAPTVAAMAALLAPRLAPDGEGAAAPRAAPSCLVRLQAGSGGAPLFLVHQVGGHVYTFRALARELPCEQPVYGLRSRGLEPGEEPLASIEAMAAHYLALVRGAQPRGPYLLGGASMGGMVAFEMARQLGAAGEEVALLALMDTPCGDQMPAREGHAESVAAVFRGRVELDLEALRRLEPEAQLELAIAAARRAARPGEDFDDGQARRQVRVIEANAAALYAHAPARWEGRLLFFRAEERRLGDPPRPELPWIELARGGVEVIIAPGNHLTMHEPPHVAALARHLRRALGLAGAPQALEPAPSAALSLQPGVTDLEEERAVALS
ncbi:MAG TPA: acyltransferase domain-containing protein, partial [Thermoanaerobaculia bacterium]|nr:acyltransferase domain-containing protein [Thermoanaerobaculia bacterium]